MINAQIKSTFKNWTRLKTHKHNKRDLMFLLFNNIWSYYFKLIFSNVISGVVYKDSGSASLGV